MRYEATFFQNSCHWLSINTPISFSNSTLRPLIPILTNLSRFRFWGSSPNCLDFARSMQKVFGVWCLVTWNSPVYVVLLCNVTLVTSKRCCCRFLSILLSFAPKLSYLIWRSLIILFQSWYGTTKSYGSSAAMLIFFLIVDFSGGSLWRICHFLRVWWTWLLLADNFWNLLVHVWLIL